MDMKPVANRLVFRRSRTVLAFLGIALLASSFPAAHAKGGGKGKAHSPPKVAVPSFTGPGEGASRAAVEKALKSRKIVVVSGGELTGAAKRLKVSLNSDDGYKAVSKALDLTGIVVGEVTNKKATLTVRTGSDGSVVGEETFTGAGSKKIAAVISKTFWKRLSGAFNKTNPPGGGGFEAPPPEPEPAGAAAEESEPAEKAPESKPVASNEGGSKKKKAKEAPAESESSPGEKSESEGEGEKKPKAAAEESEAAPEGGEEALSIFLGPAVLMRSLSYNQQRPDLSATPTGSYSLPSAPALNLRADFFPLALLGGGPLAGLGLTGDLTYLLPVVTSPGVGGNYKTVSTAFSIGLKYRLPWGLFATVAYGDDWFQLRRSSNSMSTSVVPSTDYKFARAGGGIHTQVTSSVLLDANLAYLQCIGKPGQIGGASYFPRTTCAGLEAGVGAGYKVTNAFEIRAGVDVRRFGLAFNTKPSDVTGNPATTPPIAGGAVDQYIQIYVGLAYVMGGGASDASGGGAETASDAKKSDDNADSKSGDAKSGKGDDSDDDASDDK